MTSGTCDRDARVTCRSATPSITASTAATTSTPGSRTWPRRAVATPTGSSPWRSDSPWRTACHTAWPPGTSGVINVSSCHTLPSRTGWRRREKKADSRLETDYLDWVLADFSGYLALDEMYDGPFCVLSAVDGPRQRRLLYEVLGHDPTHKDIRRFLRRLKAAIGARAGLVCGVTTDGSALYPDPLALILPGVPHQVCEFHILKDLTKVVLRVVARLRKRLAEQAPQLPRGRPSGDPEAKRNTRLAKRIGRRVAELFEYRHLFVRHHLSVTGRQRLQRLCRGQPQLRAIRQIMDEVYRLFDRRCRTETALEKLARLRQKVRRYRSLDKLKSPNLEKAQIGRAHV